MSNGTEASKAEASENSLDSSVSILASTEKQKSKRNKHTGAAKRTSAHQDNQEPRSLEAPEASDVKGDAPAVKRLVTKLYRGPPDEDGIRNWVEEYPDDVVEEEYTNKSAIALRFKKDTDELREKPLTLHSIVVHSLELKALLRKVFEGYPGFARELQKGKFQPPFTEFAHRWIALADEANGVSGTRLGEELDALREALRENFGSKPEEFEEMAKQHVVTWNLLDYLYEPGTLVITRSRNVEQAQRIVSTEYNFNGRVPSFNIETEYIDFDGNDYGLRESSLSIDRFKGSRKITSFPGIPLAYEVQQQELEDKLRTRGRRIVDLNRAKYMQYSGFVWTESRFGGRRERFIEGRILIDADGYSKYEGLGVELQPVSNELASDADALVDSNPSYKAKMDDIIQGKGAHQAVVIMFDAANRFAGQGLVILLNGPPGTGKTLTAEAIAEHLRIPIFAATAGDLNSPYAQGLEEGLSKILELSARWGAVLLLDEADAFLETRSDDDQMRNQRVAGTFIPPEHIASMPLTRIVFLRLLEYYKGVLILTTNRQVTFDPAFHSRIHLTLHYEALDEDARAAVWKTFLGASTLADDDYKQLGKHILNGRRIKNVVKMAQLLAQSQNSELGMAHLDHVLGVAMRGETSFAPEQT
ncbi:hypothetical protein PRZ48_009680 [Zasmidium cellare]|uniref:AAA+ ATPase domain-containing protein n=1 Tax=Zasmidium cellare TaxID=395010 RepID=A0ABR0EDG7_ZASCE|nr:hypothetical protein PRZ48_009680 [Zasmidium cellare]